MRFNYKIVPVKPSPVFPAETSAWIPVIPVRLSYGHGKQSLAFEAIVDSGAADCLFHAQIGKQIGLDVEKGPKRDIGGVGQGATIEAYYHNVKLWVGTGMIQIKAGFSPNLSVAGLLGRRGFFENFIIKFDPSASPPGFEIQRLGRA